MWEEPIALLPSPNDPESEKAHISSRSLYR